ncbi:MAG: hypothetical protein Q8K11_13505 [Phenylobacterium sp.]|uniref:hypothetical protein n=1 Tax=Phenylobacterium sp. TaxID=1871053 RepID=UPI00272F049D|nr:hypothetical protein [Phenylobacterium sp.]MDP2011184.1 hypothetical protein [Phenylobacterium sp.]
MDVLKTRLAKTLDLTNALAEGLSIEALKSHNGKARSNPIGGQFWCLVGARESYARAFEAGRWRGFSCSLSEPDAPGAVQAALAASRDLMLERLAAHGDLDEARQGILIDLIEHEAQHHGQLIRYFYANDLPFPPAFASRYAL